MTTVRLTVLALLVGCNDFTTLEEACLDEVPGQSNITDAEDVEIATALNCYRRLANEPKARIDPAIQQSVEGHRDYLQLHAPFLNIRTQDPTQEGFTGANGVDRLNAAGYMMPANSALLELYTVFYGETASLFAGRQHIDFWFADPFVRPAFLQPLLAGSGVATAEYTVEYPEDIGLDPDDVSVAYYNMVYTYASPPIAETAKAYPRNGQVDAPGSYVHLSANDALEEGRTYGYPITFTVGSRETGLVVEQAIISGPDGSIPFEIIYGDDAGSGVGLFNTAILVPDSPLTAGGTYTALVQLATDQGIRRARTTFTVGTDIRPVPPILTARRLPRIERNLVVAPAAP